MSKDVVIKVENLYKEYRLGTISHGTLYRDLQSWWARMRGKEDPNSIISTLQPSTGHSTIQPLNRSTLNPHFLALNDVSFEVKRGEVLGIIGRNGAGKSTLLKILSEVTSPTKGTVKIKGRVASLLEVGTGFHPELTGRENVYLNGAILGMKKREIDSKFDEIVAFAEIEKFIDTPVKRYSSGMYVRLAFAVAAHLEPEILIVDEVLAVGDAQFQKKCLGKMGSVAKEGRTVLFVSHNMGAIQSLCPLACLLESGKLVEFGASDKVVSRYFDSALEISRNRDFIQRKQEVICGPSLRLMSFNILDSNGNPMEDIPCGKGFAFEIVFQVLLEKIRNLRFGISLIDRITGAYVTEFNSYYGSEEVFSCGRGIHKFNFILNKMPLSPGIYILHFIVTSGLDVLASIRDACQLTVSDGSFYNSEQMPLPGSYPVFFSDFECNLTNVKKS